jgi:hypothetical protein
MKYIELKINKIKNPCLRCIHCYCDIEKKPCKGCNKNNGSVDNFEEARLK